MKIVTRGEEMQKLGLGWKRKGKRVAFVPTMGALHRGHLELIRLARRKGDVVVVSIYVNPTQFGPKEDFSKYPRPRTADLAKCRREKVDVVFAPQQLYPEGFSTWVREETMSQGRCGQSRPGHFQGVTTVVLKLFNLVQPTFAIFGQKDAQQVDVIQRMVRDLDVPVQIVVAETIRDQDGLALSSRNVYLSAQEREQALALPLLLRAAVEQRQPEAWLKKNLSQSPGIKVDYVETANGRLCAAVWVGKTRLIDNVAILTTKTPRH